MPGLREEFFERYHTPFLASLCTLMLGGALYFSIKTLEAVDLYQQATRLEKESGKLYAQRAPFLQEIRLSDLEKLAEEHK